MTHFTDGTSWNQHNFGSNDSLGAITFGQGLFIAVGEVRLDFYYDKLLISANGADWTAALPPWGISSLSSVAYGDGTFVAMGYEATGGALVLTSTNGTNWHFATRAFPDVPLALTYGDGKFVGSTYSGQILVSTDFGVTWQAYASGVTNSLAGIGFAHGLFVTGDAYGSILSSTNAVDWRVQRVNQYNDFRGVAWGNGTFLAIGHGSLFASTNAVDWVEKPGRFYGLLGGVYVKDTFLLGGTWGTLIQSAYAPSPRLSLPAWTPAGFEFSVTAEPDRICRIQTSTVPAAGNWIDRLTYTNSVQPLHYFDSTTSNAAHRYYRVSCP